MMVNSFDRRVGAVYLVGESAVVGFARGWHRFLNLYREAARERRPVRTAG